MRAGCVAGGSCVLLFLYLALQPQVLVLAVYHLYRFCLLWWSAAVVSSVYQGDKPPLFLQDVTHVLVSSLFGDVARVVCSNFDAGVLDTFLDCWVDGCYGCCAFGIFSTVLCCSSCTETVQTSCCCFRLTGNRGF
jgi:hypothetical protein